MGLHRNRAALRSCSSWPGRALALLFALAACAGPRAAGSAPDFDALWDFGDPAASEATFRALLDEHRDADEDWRRELHTQLARTLGLQQRFDEALEVLDAIDTRSASARVSVREHLERGRVHNSRGDKDAARPLFGAAWGAARGAGLDGLAVDAAHMLAIVEPTITGIQAWNARALELAEASDDPAARRWRGSLWNNVGWTWHDAGDFAQALAAFEASVAAFDEDGRPQRARVGRWAVARALRSLGRHAEALAAQEALLAELDILGETDGYVFEELAENCTALGREREAATWFARAYEALAQDPWLQRDEPERLARLKRLGSVD